MLGKPNGREGGRGVRKDGGEKESAKITTPFQDLRGGGGVVTLATEKTDSAKKGAQMTRGREKSLKSAGSEKKKNIRVFEAKK